MNGIIVDNFAGGGGTSEGIRMAIGHSPDIAINHDPDAIAMHMVNHPDSYHYCENVWKVDPREAAAGRPVALCWLSPDCKHFSKAAGGKPREKKIRGLAWVTLRWAATVHPHVIILENVEEFKTWGPLIDGKPDPDQKGRTFNSFVNALKRHGYVVEWRELRACDYGAPTIRKRFFLIARRDGRPIVWPEPTHGSPDSLEVQAGRLKPWRTAAEIIDWTIPCPSIFERSKPLAENTMRRIARGIQRFVIDSPNPFIVKVNHSTNDFRGQKMDEPLQTVTAKNGWGIVTPVITSIGQTGFSVERSNAVDEPLRTIVSKAEHCLIAPTIMEHNSGNVGKSADSSLPTITTGDRNYLVAPYLHKYHGRDFLRGQTPEEPIRTLDTSNRYGLVTAFISKYYAGCSRSTESSMNGPLHTITARETHAVVTSHIIKMKGSNIGHPVAEPLQTITAGGLHFGEVRAFLTKYYGQGTGQSVADPLHTVTSHDTYGLVIVNGEEYRIADIGMRMLTPRELFNAQGFAEDYIIDIGADGKPLSKAVQVARCGNAVPPPFACALVRANLPEYCVNQEAREG